MRYTGRRSHFADSEVRSPTRTEVRSPTRTATSTRAYTSGNVTVTGGAGAGNTSVYIPNSRPDQRGDFLSRNKTPILLLLGTAALFGTVAVVRNSRKRR